MAIKSKYKAKCKDCGTSYDIGDEIDTNGNKSPNKAGEMKDHWCKNGKNCQGAQQLQGSKGIDFVKLVGDKMSGPIESKDPTPEQFLELGRAMLKINVEGDKERFIQQLSDEVDAKMAQVLIKRARIEKAMNNLGLQHPSRIAFIKDVLR